jgi:hypothetical protein
MPRNIDAYWAFRETTSLHVCRRGGTPRESGASTLPSLCDAFPFLRDNRSLPVQVGVQILRAG